MEGLPSTGPVATPSSSYASEVPVASALLKGLVGPYGIATVLGSSAARKGAYGALARPCLLAVRARALRAPSGVGPGASPSP